MKFARFGPAGEERPAVVADDATIYDISSLIPDIGPDTLEMLDGLMQRVAAADGLPTVDASSVRLGPPISRPHKILGIGLNYADHATESEMGLPTSPIVFSKATSALSGPADDLILPPDANKLDWEVELGVVIGRTARRLPDSEAAADVIAGYTIVNDVSERAWQLEKSSQWTLGKSHDSFCPTGPWLVTPDEVGAVNELTLTCTVNGDIRQSGSTASMIFDVYQVVWFISQRLTLEPGDLIATGTPPGVGLATGAYLIDGDVVEMEITRLGSQKTVVRSV